jgi:hypothetical protein
VPPFRPTKKAVDLQLEERACMKGKDEAAAAIVREQRDRVVAAEERAYLGFVDQYRDQQRDILRVKQTEEMRALKQLNSDTLMQTKRVCNEEYKRCENLAKLVWLF